MTVEPAVALRDAAVGYRRRAVLEGINGVIAPGESIGLLGANGSGKTTLLKTLAGILPPVRGELLFPGGVRPVIGYVPQRESLDQTFLLSNIEVVMMGACGRVGAGKPLGKEERESATECLARTGTAELARSAFAEISGGQKQRVLIARALMARPELLLLDEPTAGVDTGATVAITALLRELNSGGMAVLMVNHDRPVIRAVARTVWWVRNGKLEIGSVEEMLKPERLEELPAE